MTETSTETIRERYRIAVTPLAGAVAAWVAEVDAHDWLRVALTIHEDGGRLISIWGSGNAAMEKDIMSAVYCVAEGLLWLRLALATSETYPDLSVIFPAADRMQRVNFELLGISAQGSQDGRPWINHGCWPAGYFPLRSQFSGQEQFESELQEYPFVQVAGDGVHEIAVGPIHAGIIEPGHFRFSVVGEKVLRLEQRLGYTHKGSDKLFVGQAVINAVRLAGRISGDSSVAYAWAYSMAAESSVNSDVPARAQWLRALMLERERVANHLGDLGALGNDAGLALGLAQFTRLKEDWVRMNQHLFGHRFMMDCIVPGGVTVDLSANDTAMLVQQLDQLEKELGALRTIYEEHAGLQDRFIGAGRVSSKLAAELGLCGMAGRASGQAWDARADQAVVPYDTLNVRMATHRNGDVAARVIVRFDEITESLRLLRAIARQMPVGATMSILPVATLARGIGWIEGWRGSILIAIETDRQGLISRCHCHDPSWQNWPVLQHAIMGNIVPDFPLINKSFNLSYSGVDR